MAELIGHNTGLVHPSVCCSYMGSELKKVQKKHTDVNVSWSKSNQ